MVLLLNFLKTTLKIYCYFFDIYLFDWAASQLQHVGSSFLARH